MKRLFTLFVLLAILQSSAIGQRKAAKVYVADVGKDKALTGSQLKRRNDEITYQAKTTINNLLDLIHLLVSNDLTDAERTSTIRNSYLPNTNRIFFDDAVTIEDDIDPAHFSPDNAVDVPVDTYLRNLDLFYSQGDSVAIDYINRVVSAVQDGPNYPYVKVYFRSRFTGNHKQNNTTYRSVDRVAELRVEKEDTKWHTYLTRLAFVRPGEGLTELARPTITATIGPKKPIDTAPVVFRATAISTDSLTARWNDQWLNVTSSSTASVPIGFYQRSGSNDAGQTSVSIALTNKDNLLTFRRIDGSQLSFEHLLTNDPKRWDKVIRRYRIQGWLQIAAGLVGLGASYAGYASLKSDYNTYTTRIASLNAEYAVWQTLTQQPAGSNAAPMSFSTYANPGIYAVYGGGLVGSGLLVNGVRQLLKARKIRQQYHH